MGASNHLAILFPYQGDKEVNHRIEYPVEAINTILNPYKDPKKVMVVDVGAGTGRISHLLAERGVGIVAIEPDNKKITTAVPHPNITFQKASAEDIPLKNNFADIVTSFQAFHWFRFNKSLKEFRRILKPSGKLALVWNYWDDTDPFTASFINLISEAKLKNTNRIDPYDGFSGKIKKFKIHMLWKFNYLPYYKNVTHHMFKLVKNTDLESLLRYAESQRDIKHEGPLWDELQARIITLANRNDNISLAYSVNVFTASPSK
ncbi:MAG: class I SAM-dependent methyltransferase [Balneolaceae bacterium]|jgi:SAM-dependent methyltransferase